MKYFIATLCFAFTLFIACAAMARPLKGFNTGPYLYLEGGVIETDYDIDRQNGQRIGERFEPAMGLTFGWNIWDFFAAEIEGRYATDRTDGRREHLVSGNAYGKYFLILDALTDFKSLRIMPTFKGGISFHVNSMPGNQSSTDTAVTTFGVGPSFGAGLSFLIAKYIFFGFDVKEDLLFLNDVHQDLTVNANIPNALIYKGGFEPRFTVMGFIGVHY